MANSHFDVDWHWLLYITTLTKDINFSTMYENSDVDTDTALAARTHALLLLTMTLTTRIKMALALVYSRGFGTGTGTDFYINVSDLIYCDTSLVQLLTLTRKRQC